MKFKEKLIYTESDLNYAINNQNITLLKKILSSNHINVNNTVNSLTPLQRAVLVKNDIHQRGSKLMIIQNIMASKNINPNERNEYGETAFHISATLQDPSIFEYFFNNNLIDKKICNNKGYNVFHYAVTYKRYEIARHLINDNISVLINNNDIEKTKKFLNNLSPDNQFKKIIQKKLNDLEVRKNNIITETPENLFRDKEDIFMLNDPDFIPSPPVIVHQVHDKDRDEILIKPKALRDINSLTQNNFFDYQSKLPKIKDIFELTSMGKENTEPKTYISSEILVSSSENHQCINFSKSFEFTKNISENKIRELYNKSITPTIYCDHLENYVNNSREKSREI